MITISTFKKLLVAFSIGLFAVVLPVRVSVPAEAFMWGVESHMYRQLWWPTEKYGVPDMSREDGFDEIIQWIDDLGVDFVRDGGRIIDLMPSEGGLINFEIMNEIFSQLDAIGVKLNWIVQESPEWARDLSNGHINNYTCPPKLSELNEFWPAIASESAQFNPIIEIWNEPNLRGKDFWSGTSGEYFTLLRESSASIKAVAPSTMVINGGFVIDYRNDEYIKNIKRLIEDGTVDMLAIHSHGNLDTLHENFTRNVAPYRIASDRIFLNESGDFASSSSAEQAKNVTGKAIYSLAHRFAGYSAYYLGLMNNSGNKDLDSAAPADSYYFLVDPSKKTPRLSYAAYKFCIYTLRSAVISKILREGNGVYHYLFQAGERKFFVAIGGADKKQATAALGTSEYSVFDMLGKLDGNRKEITYYITR
ncbi:MAG: hypothetical protein LBG12_07110 [Synergistaceae bacterium]|nr:hypothetical protein [Synergistaceae bacterium]